MTPFAIIIVGMVLLVSGAAKLYDLSEFRRSLASWSLLSPTFQDVVAVVVPIVEVVAAAAAISPNYRRTGAFVILALFTCFLVATIMQHNQDSSATCTCMGRLAAERSLKDALPQMIILQTAGVIAAIFYIGMHRAHPASVRPRSHIARRNAGYSVVELLVVVAIISLVAALTVPQLWRSRDAGRTARSLANARGHATLLTTYCDDYQNWFPWFMRLDTEFTIVRSTVSGLDSEGRYFDSQGLWNFALADGYYDGRPDHPTFWNPRFRSAVGNIGYVYPASFVTRPEWWTPDRRTEAPAQFAGTRQDEVLYPSAKVLVTSHAFPEFSPSGSQLWDPMSSAVVAAVDGHGVNIRWRDAVPAASRVDGAPPRYMSTWRHFIGQYTDEGVRGRDLK